MEWLQLLPDLGSGALLVVGIWIFSAKIIAPMLRGHQEAIEHITQVQDKNAEVVRKALEANTEAIKESVDHNERIITNHLSKEVERDAAMLSQMRAVGDSIDAMNKRRRDYDRDHE